MTTNHNEWVKTNKLLDSLPSECRSEIDLLIVRQDSLERIYYKHLIARIIQAAMVDTVPRAAVQAAVDEMRDRFTGVMHSVDPHRRGIASGVSQAADIIINHTGITPTEVQ